LEDIYDDAGSWRTFLPCLITNGRSFWQYSLEPDAIDAGGNRRCLCAAVIPQPRSRVAQRSKTAKNNCEADSRGERSLKKHVNVAPFAGFARLMEAKRTSYCCRFLKTPKEIKRWLGADLAPAQAASSGQPLKERKTSAANKEAAN